MVYALIDTDDLNKSNPQSAVAAVRTLLKGRVELRNDFADVIVDFFSSRGIAVKPDDLRAVVIALPEELKHELGHVIERR